MKAAKPTPPSATPAVEADERHQADVDAFIGRNRDQLNASIRHSRQDLEKGVKSVRTIDDIISDGRKRLGTG